MKRFFSITAVLKLLLLTGISAAHPGNTGKESENNINVIQLTTDSFKELVFNYTKNPEWKYEGTRPALVDFYATWCGPCNRLSPIVEEIAREYSGKIVVYKVDTDKEQHLTQILGISNLPTLLFIPVKGKPQASVGLMPKETIINAINNVLLVK
jgi:thioredoxin 1